MLKVSRRDWMCGKDALQPAHVFVNDLTQAQQSDPSYSGPSKHDQKLKAQRDEARKVGDSVPGDPVW